MAKKKTHKVASGEWLTKIAHNVPADEKKIWDDASNATLRAHCPNPNLLCKGSKLQIPASAQKEEAEAIDAKHKHVVKRKATAQLHLKLEHHMEKPLEVEYELKIGDATFKGTSTGGEIKHEVPIKSHVGTLVLKVPKNLAHVGAPAAPPSPAGGPEKALLEITVKLGDLNELVPWANKSCAIKGAQARLANLAFSAGPEKTGAKRGKTLPLAVDGGTGGKTREATGHFQRWADTYSPGNGLAKAGLPAVNKAMNPATASCLKKVHGV